MDLRLYTSWTTKSLFFVSSPFRISWEYFLSCQSVTREQFRTTFATSFQAHPATAGRVLVMDAGCGLSTGGHCCGPVICNEQDGVFCWNPTPHTTLRKCLKPHVLCILWLLYVLNYNSIIAIRVGIKDKLHNIK